MKKNKNKNHSYGTFITAPGRFQQWRKKAVLGILVLILLAGLGLAIFKRNGKSNEPLAETKVTETGMPGWWLADYFGIAVCSDPTCQPEADPDQDKLTNAQEYFYHTNPMVAYTVNDTINDGQLVAAGFDPSKPGRVTFDQVISDESLLGESLVFDQDIQQLVAESKNISSVNLPLVKDAELDITYEESLAVYKTYAQKLRAVIDKYFRASEAAQISAMIKSGNDADLTDIKIKTAILAQELETVKVPFRFLTFHKYNILLYQLLSKIVPIPPDVSDEWFENAKAFLAVQQRLGLEQQLLAKEFPE